VSIRVIIVDDHPVVRDGLRFCIEHSGQDIQVIAEAGDGQALLDLPGPGRADVYIMDVTMPVMNGIEATRELLRRDPMARVIMLSLHSSSSVVGEALRAGARGFLTKESATRVAVEAIQAVHQGRYFLDPDIAHYVVQGFLGGDRGEDGTKQAADLLTPRERRVLQLVAEGHSNKEIAAALEISINTVHKHRKNLMAKLDIHDQVGLVRFAFREMIAKP
jgi:DNA-binding NarL/FixJ family response regulator